MKTYLAIAAIILVFLGYIPYFRDILNKKTEPHIYSWSLWAMLTGIISFLQFKDGAGVGAYVTVLTGLICLSVVFLSFKIGKKHITKSDNVVAVLGLVSIITYFFTNSASISIIPAVAADMLAFAPTIRKSWSHPYTETVSLYGLNTARYLLITLALEAYTLGTLLFPVSWAVANGLFALMLYLRRKQIPAPK